MMTDETNPQPEEDQPVETTTAAEADSSADVEADVAAPASDTGSGRKIQIGSRRNKQETDKPQGAKPHVLSLIHI